MKTTEEILSLLKQGEKGNLECKEAVNQIPKSIYETYSAFANTNGGTILLGIHEDRQTKDITKRYTVVGVSNPDAMITSFWNTINGNKVNIDLLMDENVYPLSVNGMSIIVIEVPRADYTQRPVYIGENPLKGSFKRNHEGDYHCTQEEVELCCGIRIRLGLMAF